MPSKTEIKQLSHSEYESKSQHKEIIVACDDVKGPANIGALFRICDAFGINKIIFNSPINITSPRLKKTARNTEKNTPYESKEAFIPYIANLKATGYCVIAVELTSKSISVDQWKSPSNKMVVILGNEATGVSEEILGMADDTIHISMFGENSSLNVATAAGIVLHEISKS